MNLNGNETDCIGYAKIEEPLLTVNAEISAIYARSFNGRQLQDFHFNNV